MSSLDGVRDDRETFTEYLNMIDDDIKWTTEGEVHQEVKAEDMEKKVERCLAFLDTLSVINEDGTNRTRVFRKETHTDQYLNFDSNQPLEHKRGVVRTLTHMARSIVSDLGERKKRIRTCERGTGIQRLPRLDAGRDKGRDQGGDKRGRGSDNGNNWSEDGK